MRLACLTVLVVILAANLLAQSPALEMKMDQVMTEREMRDTGVSTLTPSQRRALDDWLSRYTARVLKAARSSDPKGSETVHGRSSCSPAIETRISGEIEGWSGETVFKLDNGQIWGQAEYAYTYFYAYRPEITIYETDSGCRMKIENNDKTVLVRRIK